MSNREAVFANAKEVARRFYLDLQVVNALEWITDAGIPMRQPGFERLHAVFSAGKPIVVKRKDGTEGRVEPEDASFVVPVASQFINALRRLPEVIREMQLLYAFALYEGAKADIVSALLKAWPVLVREDSTITYREAARIADASSLQDYVVGREARWFADGGIEEQFVRMEKRLKISPEEWPENLIHRMSVLHALRNVLIHNSGVVDEPYVRVVGDDALPVGSRVEVSKQGLRDALQTLHAFVRWLAQAVNERYGTGDDLGGMDILDTSDLPDVEDSAYRSEIDDEADVVVIDLRNR